VKFNNCIDSIVKYLITWDYDNPFIATTIMIFNRVVICWLKSDMSVLIPASSLNKIKFNSQNPCIGEVLNQQVFQS